MPVELQNFVVGIYAQSMYFWLFQIIEIVHAFGQTGQLLGQLPFLTAFSVRTKSTSVRKFPKGYEYDT